MHLYLFDEIRRFPLFRKVYLSGNHTKREAVELYVKIIATGENLRYGSPKGDYFIHIFKFGFDYALCILQQ